MNRPNIIAVSLALLVCATQAHSADRELLLQRIVSATSQPSNLPPDSPLLQQVILPARLANPNVNATDWNVLNVELRAAVNSSLSASVTATFEAMKPDFVSFSDNDLGELAALLESSVYKRYKSIAAGPAAAQRAPKLMLENAQRLTQAINSVMRAHGLKEVH
jgi:hypothetical protein